MNESAIRDQLDGLNVWQRGSQRAPHKPLLLLMSLASVLRGEPRLQPYEYTAEKLRQLLIDFGPPRQSYHPECPFWRLQNDGDFWEIPQRAQLLDELADRPRHGDVPPSLLLQHQTTGGFSSEVYDYLNTNPRAAQELVLRLLDSHFPPSMHEALLDAVGMPGIQLSIFVADRDPAFRDTIIRIYEHRCAFCGFDGKLGHTDLALDAAHVKWHATGGPDTEDNGLALCVLHHRLLDRGALGITPDYRILVSQHVHGSVQAAQYITQLSGQPLQRPVLGAKPVAQEYIEWHADEVFRSPARAVT